MNCGSLTTVISFYMKKIMLLFFILLTDRVLKLFLNNLAFHIFVIFYSTLFYFSFLLYTFFGTISFYSTVFYLSILFILFLLTQRQFQKCVDQNISIIYVGKTDYREKQSI